MTDKSRFWLEAVEQHRRFASEHNALCEQLYMEQFKHECEYCR